MYKSILINCVMLKFKNDMVNADTLGGKDTEKHIA